VLKKIRVMKSDILKSLHPAASNPGATITVVGSHPNCFNVARFTSIPLSRAYRYRRLCWPPDKANNFLT